MDNPEPDVWLSRPKQRRRYGVADRTLYRWEQDTALGMPAATDIAGRLYRKLSDLEQWEQRRAEATKPRAKARADARSESIAAARSHLKTNGGRPPRQGPQGDLQDTDCG